MIDYSILQYRVDPMTAQDITAVMQIEQEAFTAPWSARAYEYELHFNEMAHYFVARPQRVNGNPVMPPLPTPAAWWQRLLRRDKETNNPPIAAPRVIAGYGGFWLMVDEAHISTIASHRDERRRGIGELLLVSMMDRAAEIGAQIATLEARASNLAAQMLYRKYGFEVTGTRTHYYSDNGEDALIMSTPIITAADFQRRIQELKRELFTRLSQ